MKDMTTKPTIVILIAILLQLTLVGIVSGGQTTPPDDVPADESAPVDTPADDVAGGDDNGEDDRDGRPGVGPPEELPAVPAVAKGRAKNAAAFGKPTFLTIGDYKPWAVMVVNAGDPWGVDLVTVDYDAETHTLTINVQDTNSTNCAVILINKNFIDEYISDDPDNLDIELSEAVNYKGMSVSNATAGYGAVYVFHIEHFSIQTIVISPVVYVSTTNYVAIGVAVALVAIATVYVFRKRKEEW